MVYCFALVVACCIAAIILSGTWNKRYFSTGFPIYAKKISCTHNPINQEIIERLNVRFASMVWTGLAFRDLGPTECGFREKFFQFRFLNYTPIMHGVITYDAARSELSVIGRTNWTPLFFVAMFLGTLASSGGTTIGESVAIAVAAVIGIFGMIYLIQAVRFKKVATFLAESEAEHSLKAH